MKKLLNGNEALAYGAMASGLEVFAGYPITPSTEIYETFERELEGVGGVFINAESEMSAINIVFGAYISGKRAMTATSSCGFSLMQGAISYMAADFTPAVIVNVTREGAGLGDIKRSQGDYWCMTKGGGNGDYHNIVMTCKSVIECYEAANIAFQLAEKYRNPVVITYDSDVAHTKEAIEIEELNKNINKLNYDYMITGNKSDQHKVIQNVYYHDSNFDETLSKKYAEIEKSVPMFSSYNVDVADIIIVAYGICARVARDVIMLLNEKNIKNVGLIELRTLYPFPKVAFENLKAKIIVSYELNILKQMRDDIIIACDNKIKVLPYGNMSKMPLAKELLDFIIKEVVPYV